MLTYPLRQSEAVNRAGHFNVAEYINSGLFPAFTQGGEWPERANHALSVAYFYSQRYDDGAEAAQNVVDANPVYSLPRAILAAAFTRLGRADDAKAMAQTVLEREPSFTIRGTARYAELDPVVFKPFADAWREAGLPE